MTSHTAAAADAADDDNDDRMSTVTSRQNCTWDRHIEIIVDEADGCSV